MPRESLLGVLWLERDPESARHALEQALYTLRRDLGGDAVVGTDPVRLGPGMACDVVDFEAAIDRDDWQGAIAICRGPLVEGLHIRDAPAFDQWVDRERERLSLLLRRAILRHAADCTERGDHDAAAEAWQRYSREDPLSPTGARGLVQALVASGHPTRARAVVEGWERLVRSELHGDPDPTVRAALEASSPSAPPHGSRPPAVGAPSRVVLEASQPAATAAPAAPATRRRRSWLVPVMLAGGAVLAWSIGSGDSAIEEPGVRVGHLDIRPFRMMTADSTLASIGGALPAMLASRFEGVEEDLLPPGTGGNDRWTIEGTVLGDRVTSVIGLVLRQGEEGTPRGRVEATGTADQLDALLDVAVAQLLVGLPGVRLASAGETPLPAVVGYLVGRRRFAASEYHAAGVLLRRALVVDSALAPAAILLGRVSALTDGADVERGDRLAWQARERLEAEERALLEARLGPDYPQLSPPLATLGRLRQHAAGHLQHAEGWYELGSLLSVSGHALGQEDPWGEARSAFERALALDSAAARPALAKLAEMAAIEGDTALLARVMNAEPDDPAGRTGEAWRRWLRAFTARDTGALERMRPALASLDSNRLLAVRVLAQRAGVDLAGAREATRLWVSRARTGPERSDGAGYLHRLALNLGDVAAARASASGMLREWSEPDRIAEAAVSGAWWGDDSLRGASAAESLMGEEEVAVGGPTSRAGYLLHRCAAEQFRVTRAGKLGTAMASARLLRTDVPATPSWLAPLLHGCSLYLEGMVLAAARSPDAGAVAEALERWQSTWPLDHWAFPEPLAAGALWAALGDWQRASRVLERRSPRQVRYLAPTLRLAAVTAFRAGDHAAAGRASRHYLALMGEADPSLRGQVDEVRRIAVEATPGP